MKRLTDLTKKERAAWIAENGVRRLGKLLDGDTSVKYIKENNTKEEIAKWLKNATTTYIDVSCAPYFCTVFEYNRLSEYVKEA